MNVWWIMEGVNRFLPTNQDHLNAAADQDMFLLQVFSSVEAEGFSLEMLRRLARVKKTI